MQTFLKLLAVLFILVPTCTASISLPKEFLNYSNSQIRNVKFDEGVNSTKAYIAPIENQLKQCGEMEEKIMLLELQTNETNKANQQLDEYKSQIEKQAAENKILKSEVQKLNDKIQQLENEQNDCELTIQKLGHLNDDIGNQEESCQMDLESERFDSNEKDVTIDGMKKVAEANRKLLDECQLNNTNLVKLKYENFKEYQSNQQIILESCQNDLESQRNESTYKNVTIKELKEVSEGNLNLWTQCQKNREEVQTELDSYKTKDANINSLVKSCKEQLESQRIQTAYKNATINELNKALDEYKKNNAELNNWLSIIEKCHKQCNGKGYFTNAWCKVKCKWNC